jgi:hypothetical protein
MNIKKILSYFQYPGSDIKIIGTFKDDNLKYYNDIDMQNNVEYVQRGYKPLLTFFRRIFNHAFEKKIYITDFKAGFYNGFVIRWNHEEIDRGYKQVSDDYQIDFVDVFKMKSMIKIDFIVSLDGIFTECSVNYYFHIVKNNFSTRPELVQQYNASIYQDYKKYLNNREYYKATKRLYRFFKAINDKVNVNRIEKFMNSEVGHYSYIMSHLNNIKQLIEYDEDIKLSDLKSSIKNLLNDTKYYEFSKKIKDKHQIILLIKTINTMLKERIDKESLEFLQTKIKSHDIIIQLYKNKTL